MHLYISSAAVWPARKRPGSWPRPAFPSSCTRCGPTAATEAHQTGELAELVCSNSLRSDDADYNAVGLLHEEMRALGSLILAKADAHKVPAGGALAVDREGFSAGGRGGAGSPSAGRRSCARKSPACRPHDWDQVIIATGPLTSPPLAEAIRGADRRRLAWLLRRHRPDRPQGQHRFFQGLVPVALRQGRPAPTTSICP